VTLAAHGASLALHRVPLQRLPQASPIILVAAPAIHALAYALKSWYGMLLSVGVTRVRRVLV
jgi:hypothetical protein